MVNGIIMLGLKKEFEMEFNYYLQKCGDNDVISFSNEMCKLGNFKQAIESAFQGKVADELIESLESSQIKGIRIGEYTSGGRGSRFQYANYNYKWFSEGKDCEILRIGGKGWEKGKLRIKLTLEFDPDEPETKQQESPLDDLRQMLNENNL